jgi:hypothetical protein
MTAQEKLEIHTKNHQIATMKASVAGQPAPAFEAKQFEDDPTPAKSHTDPRDAEQAKKDRAAADAVIADVKAKTAKS